MIKRVIIFYEHEDAVVGEVWEHTKKGLSKIASGKGDNVVDALAHLNTRLVGYGQRGISHE